MRRWWASNAAATRPSSGSAGASSTRPTTDSVSSTGHPTAAQTSTSPASSSPVIRSSSAEAVIRLAPARSSGRSCGDVRQPRLDDDGGAVGGRAGRVGGGDLQQVGVAVVHDPVLRPRQERREPPAHRSAAAGEVVDHRAAGRRELPPELLDQVARPGGGVGRLAQVEPFGADPDLLDGHARRLRQDACEDGRGGRPPRERRAPFARGPAQPPRAARRRPARPAARRRAQPGRRAARAAPAGPRRRRDRGPPAPRRPRSRPPAGRGRAPR